ncbi:MAG TPA: hypothetical protein VGH55_02015, partial [Chthoniobacterales bacterium]
FYGIKHRGRAYIYTRGLVLSKELQERERLLHCAAYMAQEYAPDDPWSALKRLLRAKIDQPISDLAAVVSGGRLLAKGLGVRLFESNAVPQQIRNFVVDAMIKLNPNFVVREFQTQGMPHKLKGILINGVTEQVPDPESRITLSDKRDPLGLPMARIDWRIGDQARRSLIRLGHLLAAVTTASGSSHPGPGRLDRSRTASRQRRYRYSAHLWHDADVGRSKARRGELQMPGTRSGGALCSWRVGVPDERTRQPDLHACIARHPSS